MNIYDDPQTLRPEQFEKMLTEFEIEPIGHYFLGHDGLVYRVIGYRIGDGPWVQEVLGRSFGTTPSTRTISRSAIGRTFHHHRKCPMPGCRAAEDVQSAEQYGPMREIFWCNATQRLDENQTAIEITVPMGDQTCIAGILNAEGSFVRKGFNHSLMARATPNTPIRFETYLEFCADMFREWDVVVSRAFPIKFAEPTPIALRPL